MFDYSDLKKVYRQRSWTIRTARETPRPKNQQTSDDFIANGGKVVYGNPVKEDLIKRDT